MKKKVIFGTLVGVLFISAGLYFGFIYQSPEKTDVIYKSALEDFNKGEYQNAYYLFSKISLFSNLKPVAIYHRAECAKMLSDTNSELKQLEILFNNYPKHVLSIKSRYYAAQKLVKDKPQIAKKYFEYIVKNAPDTDYAIASEYYLGVILKEKFKKEKIVSTSEKNEVQNYFRHYLKQAPSGRLALNAVNNWLEITDNISADDYLLMANTCYLFGEYEKARELLSKAEITLSWALDVKISYALKNYPRAKFLTEEGLQKYSQYVEENDVIEAIDIYLKFAQTKSSAIERLLAFSKANGRSYLLSLKCQNVNISDKEACYSQLYLDYPDGRFSAEALANMFFAKIKKRDLSNAQKIGRDHINKFPNVNSTPMVMFWLGKIAEMNNNYSEYNDYYEKTIERFPDNYYAYRAYLRLKHLQGPIITNYMNPQEVVYPYKYAKNNIIVKLVELGDFDTVNDFAGDDDFIKSWVLFKKGDYSHSMLLARDAMEKLEIKPDKYDLRWRLVYPVHFYDEAKKYSTEAKNSLPLILGIIREESFFDPLAQSEVGASGLMQLMPATASEINSKYNLGLIIPSALFNPTNNIKLGNYYYSLLRNNLGYDISAVAAYNGGIGSLQRWKNSISYNDTDEFVEQIPYAETKNYVKKVFRSYWNYIRIYSEH